MTTVTVQFSQTESDYFKSIWKSFDSNKSYKYEELFDSFVESYQDMQNVRQINAMREQDKKWNVQWVDFDDL